MGIRVKQGISTTVSIPIVIGRNEETGEYATQEKLFLPGALLPSNTHPSIQERLDSGETHINDLLESDGAEAIDLAASPFNIVEQDLTANPFAQNEVGNGEQPQSGAPAPITNTDPPAGDGSDETPVDYSDWKREDLDSELAQRLEAGHEIDVVGTGANGNIKAADIAAALKADDEAQATA